MVVRHGFHLPFPSHAAPASVVRQPPMSRPLVMIAGSRAMWKCCGATTSPGSPPHRYPQRCSDSLPRVVPARRTRVINYLFRETTGHHRPRRKAVTLPRRRFVRRLQQRPHRGRAPVDRRDARTRRRAAACLPQRDARRPDLRQRRRHRPRLSDARPAGRRRRGQFHDGRLHHGHVLAVQRHLRNRHRRGPHGGEGSRPAA